MTIHLVSQLRAKHEFRQHAAYLLGRRVRVALFEPADGKGFDGLVQAVHHGKLLPRRYIARNLELWVTSIKLN